MKTAITHGAIVVFDSIPKAAKGFSVFVDWVKKTQTKSVTSFEIENGNYNVWGIKYRDQKNYFSFCVDSNTTEQHYEQIHEILDFCKTLNGVNEFCAPVMLLDQNIHWTKSLK